MATITRKGVTTDLGETITEFKARQTVDRIKTRGLSSSEKATGYTEKQFIDYYEFQTAEAGKQRAIQDAKDPLSQSQPKGSVKVTKADGDVVFRTTGVTSQGRYVDDVYQKIQQQNIIREGQGQYKEIPRSAKKVSTEDGDVFRVFTKDKDKTFVTDYKPGGVTETKLLKKGYVGGESVFIPKPADPKRFLPSLTDAFSLGPSPKKDVTPSTSLSTYAETLIKREQRLQDLKTSVYSKLHIQGQQNAKWYNLFEIGKGVARVPFEIASIPSFLYGRVNLATRSVFDPAGRQMLKQGVKDTPSAVREVFIHRDAVTGEYQFTAQNVVNVGLTALMVRRVAKSPSNPVTKFYEKHGTTNIKGTIRGNKNSFAVKSAGKLKGRAYKEVTVIKGKASTSTIKYQGKTYIVHRNAKGGGTYKIIKTKTALSINRKGPIPKSIRTYKKTVVLKKGTFKPGSKPITFKVQKGVTTQDIQFLNQKTSVSYIRYLEKLRTTAKASGDIKSGSQTLKFDATAKIKVDNIIQGRVTSQKVIGRTIKYKGTELTAKGFKTKVEQVGATQLYNKPTIKFLRSPKYPKDLIKGRQIVKPGVVKELSIIQPRHQLLGTSTQVFKGKFTITGGGLKNPFAKSPVIKPLQIKGPGVVKPVKVKPVNFKSSSKPKIDSNTVPKSVYKSKPSPLSEQIALTDQIHAETIYNVPFLTQAKTPGIFQSNLNLLNKPIGTVKSLPLVPIVQQKKSVLQPVTQIKPLFTKLKNVYSVKTSQTVRPTNIYKSVVDQIQIQKPIADIKVGQTGRSKSITEQVQVQVPAQVQIQSQVPIQSQIPAPQSVFQNVFNKVRVAPGFRQAQALAIPKPFALPKFDFSAGTQKGFFAFTRIKGKFKQANIKPLSEQDAINFGAFRVQNTSQATFKVIKANAPVQDVFKIPANLKDFYQKDDLFIEKRERRIKSIGELREITFKGIQARKQKSVFGKSIFGGR